MICTYIWVDLTTAAGVAPHFMGRKALAHACTDAFYGDDEEVMTIECICLDELQHGVCSVRGAGRRKTLLLPEREIRTVFRNSLKATGGV